MSDKPELKPCPFCGKLATTYKDSDGYWTIICSFSDCLIVPFGKALNEQSVIDAWNQRADLAKPSEWVSVDDRLPEAGEYVLAYFTNALVNHLNWGLHPQIITRQLVTEKGERWADEGVTHWQPLPSPPDKETP